MRIVGEIKHPRMKITIFRWNEKLSVKFEKNSLESIFKFSTEECSNVEDLKSKFSIEAIQQVERNLDSNVEIKNQCFHQEDKPEQFDEII